jgi:hypothetical protein
MRDEPETPPRNFQLKPRAFDTVNPPGSQRPANGAPTDVRGHLDAANAGQSPLRKKPLTPPAQNDVQALMRDHASKMRRTDLDESTPRPRRSSARKRDYWLVLLPTNAFFAFFAFGPFRNPMTLAFGVGGMVITTVGLTWVRWFVMDDY